MPKFKREGISKLGLNLTPKQLVLNFLRSEGRSRRGPIEKFIVEQTGMKYSDHKGLDYILRKLIEEGLVRKLSKERGIPYPLYELTPKGIDDIYLEARYFAVEAIREIVYYDLKKETVDSIIEKTLRKIGVFAIFSMIQASKRALAERTEQKKMEVVDAWLDNTFPMRNAYSSLYYEILNLNYNKNDKHVDVSKYMDEISFLKALDKKLLKLFPIETKRYQTILNETKKKKAEYKRLFKYNEKVSDYRRYVENLKKKFTKEQKCPNCLYDGSTPIAKNPSKKTFLVGIYTFKSMKKRYSRICPSCGFKQAIKRKT